MDQVTVSRELLRQAEELLSSLITYDWHNKPKEDIDKKGYECAEAIRAALEQPAVEPEKTNAKESNADLDFYSNAAINEQRRNMVREVEVGQSLGNGQNQSTGNSEPQGAVAVITGFDEYGPFLDWHTHWANLPVGARLCTAPQAQPAVEPTLPDITSTVVNDMCWKIVEELPESLSGANFNALKPALYEALKLYTAPQAQPAQKKS